MKETLQQTKQNLYEQRFTLGDKIMVGFIAVGAVVGTLTLSNVFDSEPGVCIDVDNMDILPPANAPKCLEIFGIDIDVPFLSSDS
jgi:hypothetical protein